MIATNLTLRLLAAGLFTWFCVSQIASGQGFVRGEKGESKGGKEPQSRESTSRPEPPREMRPSAPDRGPSQSSGFRPDPRPGYIADPRTPATGDRPVGILRPMSPPTPGGGGASGGGIGFPVQQNPLSEEQDRRLRELEDKFNRRERNIAEEKRRDRDEERNRALNGMRNGGGAIAPFNVRPLKWGNRFNVSIDDVHIDKQSTDDGDDNGDEVFLRCATGYYDKDKHTFVLVSDFVTKLYRNNRTGGALPIDNAEDGLPLVVFSGQIVPGNHVLMVVPSIWEEDQKVGEADAVDRAAEYYEQLDNLEDDIRPHLEKLGTQAHGIKAGNKLGLPAFSGATGRNRPIGMKHNSSKATSEFVPQALLLDYTEAARLIARGGDEIQYVDEQRLGAKYRLRVRVQHLPN